MKLIIAIAIALSATTGYAKTKVAILDTGFSGLYGTRASSAALCKSGHYDFTTSTPNVGFDIEGHGSFVANLIVENAPDADFCIVVFKVNVYSADKANTHITAAIVKAYRQGVKAVNISLGIPVYSHRQRRVMKTAARRGMKIFSAAGNSGKSLNKMCSTYPGCYRGKNMYTIGATDRTGLLETYSNRGAIVQVYEYGTIPGIGRGTSFAAPRALARYLREIK